MNCSGIEVATGQSIGIEFDYRIRDVWSVDRQADPKLLVAPGFIDIQVNGFGGIDFNDPEATLSDTAQALDHLLATGVTRCLPTVITGPPDHMLACLTHLRRAQRGLPRRRLIAGFHVEGPHISPEDGPRGAHPAEWVRPPDISEFHRWQEATNGNIRLVTLSPHWPEAPAYIAAITQAGVTAAIGHTGATTEQIAAAVKAGATLSTHLGNGAHAALPRRSNYIWDQLADDRLSASFIVDGIHLHNAFLQTALRAKNVARSVLVTDASAPADARPGRYRLGAQDVDLTPDGRVVLAGTDRLAGSALRMNDGVLNLTRLGGLTLREAVATATVNPARVIRLEGRMAGIERGDIADLVLFRRTATSIEIEAVFIEGERAR